MVDLLSTRITRKHDVAFVVMDYHAIEELKEARSHFIVSRTDTPHPLARSLVLSLTLVLCLFMLEKIEVGDQEKKGGENFVLFCRTVLGRSVWWVSKQMTSFSSLLPFPSKT